MRVKDMKEFLSKSRPRPATPERARQYVARLDYALVLDPGDGDLVRTVVAIEWDDDHKALIVRAG